MSSNIATSRQSEDSVSTEEALLTVDNLRKTYRDDAALDELSLAVSPGEFVTLLGPSGCGKTTTLRLLAGLERPTQGHIELAGDVLADEETFVKPEHRDIGIVFQDFALFPHLSAAENIAFGLQEVPKSDRSDRVQELLALVDLEGFEEYSPDELSGGQQQRVALARSLAPEPEVLLLDEPFSNLDVGLRVRMREELRRIVKEAGVTTISVTHDQEEALSISDRVVILNDGHLEQVGRPETVFQQPTSRFVAGFLGHASFVHGYIRGDLIETDIGRIGRDQVHGLAGEYDNMAIDIMVRPDDVIARPVDDPAEADGEVTYRRYLGPTVLYRVELISGDVVECMHNHTDDIELDQPVRVELPATHELAWFPQSAPFEQQSSPEE